MINLIDNKLRWGFVPAYSLSYTDAGKNEVRDFFALENVLITH